VVERLKEAIYSRTARPEINAEARSPFTQVREKIPSTWTTSTAPADANLASAEFRPSDSPNFSSFMTTSQQSRKKGLGTSHYFLIVSVLFFFAALGVAGWTVLGGFNIISSQNIDLSIVAPALVDSGKTATVQFIIDNKNKTPLQAMDIVIDYPDGTRDASDPTQSFTHDRISVGDLAPGAQIQKTSAAVFFGAEGSQQAVHATVEYQIAGSNAVFTKQADAMLVIGSAPISLAVNAPTEAIAGQTFDTTITVTANATNPIPDVAVEAQYPFGFTVQSTDPAAQAGNTMWRLGTLKPGEARTIHIVGALSGEEGDIRVFHLISGSESDQTNIHVSVPVISEPYTLTVRRPFVSGMLSINNKSGTTFSAPPGTSVQGSIDWKNNLTTTISNMQLTLTLTGAVDPASVQASGGFYDSAKHQITWDTQGNASFASVAPGASGSLQFSFAPPAASAQTFRNPRADLVLGVRATRSGTAGSVPETVASAATASVQFSSSATLSAHSLHSSGPLRNSGPVPPQVGQDTTYSIVWSVSNSSNSLANAAVSATLPPNVKFVSGGSEVDYNDSSRTVTWTLGDVSAGAGYGSSARTTTFQVMITPSATQVGSAAPLVGAAHLTASDRYAQTPVSADAPAATTLTADSGATRGMEIVH